MNFQIASGIDVAQSLTNSSYMKSKSDTSSLHSDLSSTPQSSELGKMLALNEDEALKIILSNTKQKKPSPNNNYDEQLFDNPSTSSKDTRSNESVSTSESTKSPQENVQRTTEHTFEEPSSLGNSLNRQSGWSFDESQNETTETPAQVTRTVSIEGARSNEHSYHALIESYNMVSDSDSKVPNLQEVWQRFGDTTENILNPDAAEISWPNNTPEDFIGFECIKASYLDKAEFNVFLAQVGKLAQEKGLDNQNYECFGCKHPLGINVCKSR